MANLNLFPLPNLKSFARQVLFSALITLSLLSCSNNKKAFLVENKNKKHKVAPAKFYEISYLKADSSTQEFISEIDSYNVDGKLIYSLSINNSTDTAILMTYKYVGDKLNSKNSHNYNSGEIISESFEYDSDGKVTRTKWINQQGDVGTNVFAYDDYANQISLTMYKGSDKLVEQVMRTVTNDVGLTLESERMDALPNGDTLHVGMYSYIYDSLGRVALKTEFGKDGALVKIDQNMWDNNNNNIVQISNYPDTVLGSDKTLSRIKVLNVYNEFGDIIRANVFEYNIPILTTQYTYNEYGETVKLIDTDKDGRQRIVRKEIKYRT